MPRCSVKKGHLAGVLVLLIVDIIWVGSAGITRYLYTKECYEKPLFTTYFKTVLFTIYLLPFIFWRPWQRMCVVRGRGRSTLSSHYQAVQESNGRDLNRSGSPEVHPNEVETTVSDVNEQTGQCEFPATEREEGEDKEIGEVEKGAGEGAAKREEAKRYFQIPHTNATVNGGSCPIDPDMKVCLVGPPEFEPLNCRDTEEDDSEQSEPKPLPPCRNRCSKVRFKPTIEIRHAQCDYSISLGSSGQRPCELVCERRPQRRGPAELLPVWRVGLLAAIFGVLWFFANYLYQEALDKTSVATVNTLSSMSGIFVMILAAIPFLQTTERDKFTLSRLVVTLLSVCGAVLVSLSPDKDTGLVEVHFNVGAVMTIAGAVLYAFYIVILRRAIPDPDSLEIPMFFGFVGLFDAIAILPIVIIWHFTGVETFEIPPNSDIWTLLLVNGFVGTVLSELLWLVGVFLTSPLLGTLSLSLVTPLSVAYSVAIGDAQLSVMFFLGTVFIVLGFFLVSVLDHYGAWDPLWTCTKRILIAAKDIRTHRGYHSLSEESQSLISGDEPACTNDYNVMFY